MRSGEHPYPSGKLPGFLAAPDNNGHANPSDAKPVEAAETVGAIFARDTERDRSTAERMMMRTRMICPSKMKT